METPKGKLKKSRKLREPVASSSAVLPPVPPRAPFPACDSDKKQYLKDRTGSSKPNSRFRRAQRRLERKLSFPHIVDPRYAKINAVLLPMTKYRCEIVLDGVLEMRTVQQMRPTETAKVLFARLLRRLPNDFPEADSLSLYLPRSGIFMEFVMVSRV